LILKQVLSDHHLQTTGSIDNQSYQDKANRKILTIAQDPERFHLRACRKVESVEQSRGKHYDSLTPSRCQSSWRAITLTQNDPFLLSQGIRVGDLIFISGQAGYADDGRIVDGGFRAQGEQAFSNLDRALVAGGSNLNVEISPFGLKED